MNTCIYIAPVKQKSSEAHYLRESGRFSSNQTGYLSLTKLHERTCSGLQCNTKMIMGPLRTYYCRLYFTVENA